MLSVIEHVSKKERMRLSAILQERSVLNLLPIMLTSDSPRSQSELEPIGYYGAGWKALIDREFPRSISEKFDRTLRNLSRRGDLGHWIEQSMHDGALYYAETDDAHEFILRSLIDDKLIEQRSQGGPIRLTAHGWSRLAEIERGYQALKYRQAFVAMWFDESMASAWNDGFVPGIEQGASVKAMRVDLKEHNEKICDVIVAEIRKSSFLIADFTGNRGGVYFEAGFAKGLGIPVIFSCQKGEWTDKLHFDTRQYNHIIWKTPADLASKLKNRIAATIQIGDAHSTG
jgi:hypothetical protein